MNTLFLGVILMSSSNQIRDNQLLEQVIRRGLSPERGRQGFKKALGDMRDRKSVEEKLDRYTQKLSQVLNDFDLIQELNQALNDVNLNQLFCSESGLKFVDDIKELASEFTLRILHSRHEISIADLAQKEKINGQLNKLLKVIETNIDILNSVKYHLVSDHAKDVILYMDNIRNGAESVSALCDSSYPKLDIQMTFDHSNKLLKAIGMNARFRTLDWLSVANSIKHVAQEFLNICNQGELSTDDRSLRETTEKMFMNFFEQIKQTLTKIKVSNDSIELRQQKLFLDNLQLLLDKSIEAYQHVLPGVNYKMFGLIDRVKSQLCEITYNIESQLPRAEDSTEIHEEKSLAETCQVYFRQCNLLATTIDRLTEVLNEERQQSSSSNNRFSFFRKKSKNKPSAESYAKNRLLAKLTNLKRYADDISTDSKETRHQLQQLIEDTLRYCSPTQYLEEYLRDFQQTIGKLPVITHVKCHQSPVAN
jgi:hypothetical protein